MSGPGAIEGLRPIVIGKVNDVGQQAEANDLADDVADARASRDSAAQLRAQNQLKSRVASKNDLESRRQTRDAKQEARERGKAVSSDSGDVARARQAEVVQGNFGVASVMAPHSPFFERATTGPRTRDDGQSSARSAADPIDVRVEARVTDGLSSFDSQARAGMVLAKGEATRAHDDPKTKDARKPEAPPPSAQTAAAQKTKAGAPPPPMPTVQRPKVAFSTPANPWNHVGQSFGYEDHVPAPLDEGGEGSSADQPHSTSNEYKIPA